MDQDADDVLQEVLAVVVRRIPEFHRGPRVGAFRAWGRTITVNAVFIAKSRVLSALRREGLGVLD